MALDLGTLVGYLELDTKKWEGPLGDMGKKMPGWMAAAGATAAVAVAAAFGAALVNAVNIDAANDKIAAQLGLTEEESAKAGEAAAGAYTNAFGESMEAVQGATAGVIGSIKGMREASVAEIQGITEKVLTLSDGFEMEADRISQVVGQMISTGLVENAEQGLDLLTAALQKVPPAVREDIIDAVDEYGPFFAQIGMDGDAAMSALVAASEKGMYGIDKTGDALKEFTIRGTDMSATSVEAYEAMGLSAEEMSAALLAGGETGAEAFDMIVAGLLGIEDPVAQSQAALALFGTPLEDLGTNEIPGFLGSLQDIQGGLGDTAGAAQAMADTIGGNVSTQWTGLTRQFEGIMTTIAEGLLPVLEPLMAWLVDNPAAVEGFALVLGVLAVAFMGLSVATWASNAAFLASPITWIVLGIVALVAALVWLISNWDEVVAWISEVWAGFISWITGVIDGFVAWWNEVWAGFASWITSVWEGFVGWITGIWEGFISWVTGIIDGFVAWWNGLWAAVGQTISDTWQGFVGFITGVWDGFVGWIMGVLSGFIVFWSGIWETVSSSVRDIWEGIISWFQGIPDAIFNVFMGAATWLYNIGKDIVQGLWDGLKSIWTSVSAWFEDTFGGIIDTVAGIFQIKSPSRVFREIGQFVGQGFIDGLDEMNPEIDAAVDEAFGPIPGNAPQTPEDAPGSPGTLGGTFHYHAAENQSLSDEEALFAALGSPRSPFGGK